LNLILDKNNILKFKSNGIVYIEDSNGELKMGDGKEIIEILENMQL